MNISTLDGRKKAITKQTTNRHAKGGTVKGGETRTGATNLAVYAVSINCKSKKRERVVPKS